MRALMPLHKPKCVAMYHQQLAYCVTQVDRGHEWGALSVHPTHAPRMAWHDMS